MKDEQAMERANENRGRSFDTTREVCYLGHQI